ncbi:MAG: endonuclease III [Candidatus Kryptoniota bacterium]
MTRKTVPIRTKSQRGTISTEKRARKVLALLKKEYPEVKSALNFSKPFELLIATILSAQCTDARVNMVTPGLFRRHPSPKSLAEADLGQIEEEIKSTGFYRQKAKSIVNCSKSIMEKFGGEVPRTMEQLLSLDGVGRKTANVVLGNAFGVPGIAVDTHVKRLAHRLGFTKENDPAKIEFDLMEMFPKKEWTNLCHLLMSHGRKACVARLPKCDVCVVDKLCPSAFTFMKKEGMKFED